MRRDQQYHEVADLLEEDDDARRRVVVLGVGPDQADNVHHRLQVLLQVLELRLLDLLEVRAQWLQVQVDVLRLRQRCDQQTR